MKSTAGKVSTCWAGGHGRGHGEGEVALDCLSLALACFVAVGRLAS